MTTSLILRSLSSGLEYFNLIITLLCYLSIGPFGSALCKKLTIRQVVMAGAIVTSVSFMIASISTHLWHLYVTFAAAGKQSHQHNPYMKCNGRICTYLF